MIQVKVALAKPANSVSFFSGVKSASPRSTLEDPANRQRVLFFCREDAARNRGRPRCEANPASWGGGRSEAEPRLDFAPSSTRHEHRPTSFAAEWRKLGGDPLFVKDILLATDGSANALKAAQLAGELAACTDATLHVLAVAYRDPSEEQALREFARIEDLEGGVPSVLAEFAKRRAEQAREQAEVKGAKAIETTVAVGDPTEEILNYVKKNHIDAVVVGRRGSGRLAGLLLGDVAQNLASLAPCVVIICP